MKQLMFQRMNVRFVECTGGKVIPREEFLGFVKASETTSEYLADSTREWWSRNMLDIHRGVQAMIRER